jgi:hypothetical protein
MQGMGSAGESCPFTFNFDADTFKVGDVVSYRVTGSLTGYSFVGTLLEVHDDHVIISADDKDGNSRMPGTRESRPLVQEADALA